nr:YhcH/YjgK/YiaL family protein [uncultured Sphaerochaeta sp.]
MIHDTIDQLTFYASAIPHLQQVALLDTASTSIEGLQVLFAQYTTAPFGGTFMVHPSKVCVVLTLQGSELLVTTYRRKDQEGPKDENGFISIPDSQVTDVIRLDEGTFTVFMPGEPFSYGVQDEKGPARVKHLLIVLEES